MKSYRVYRATYQAMGGLCLRGHLVDKDGYLVPAVFLAHISEMKVKFEETVDEYLTRH